ncbi:MAG: hypothetical protein E6G87_10625 [Alphaproteobacteria bacterium]|nr:MAG: hypothetical protein E6G87_10625 [Alphaproteobacteria bacterium]
MYSVRGRTAATAANISDAVFGFWNPHTSQIVRLMALTVVAQTLIANVWLAGTFRRTTARGMPAATVTPDISNDGRRGANPVSGVLLDLAAFSVQPTLEADDWGPNISASQQARRTVGKEVDCIFRPAPALHSFKLKQLAAQHSR